MSNNTTFNNLMDKNFPNLGMSNNDLTNDLTNDNNNSKEITKNKYFKADGVGTWSGTCKCPDGNIYDVGDNGDNCGSLACINGISDGCSQSNTKGAGMKVICAPLSDSKKPKSNRS